MTLSELTVDDVLLHTVLTEDTPDYALLPGYLEAAKRYVLGYTGLSIELADSHPELAVAALIATAELVKNKELSVDGNTGSRVSEVLSGFLGMHDRNLL